MNETFRELFEKYMGENISPQEIIRLKQYIRDESNSALLDQLLAEAFTDKALPVTADYALEEVFQALMDKATDSARVVRFPRFRWLRYAAAAILLLGMGAAVDYGVHRHKEAPAQQPLAARRNTDIGPGKDQAILTLSGGGKVTLDSTVRGTISNQGGTTVSNVNGRISYKAGSGVKEVLYNTITTARGNQYQLVLPDGTKVWLNAASSVRFPTAFSGPERRVELTGEGYFAVAKDVRHPFIVSFNHSEVQVLGTEFDVMAYSDEPATRTTLVSGSISLANGTAHTILKPGNTAEWNDRAFTVSPADVQQVTAWRSGEWSFNNVEIPVIMRQLSRWYDIDINYRGKTPEGTVGGVISRNVDLSTVLEFLESTGIHFRQDGRRITVLP